MAPNYDRLVDLVRQKGKDRAKADLQQMMEQKLFRPTDFSFTKLFEACFGYSELRACREGNRLANDVMSERLMESQGAVTTDAFQAISGQIVYSMILEAYQSEEFVFSKIIPTVQTQLSGEKIAGISRIGDEALVVPEGEPFPLVGVRQDWIRTPETKKRGMIVPVTREAVFFDRTGVLLERCREVGYWLGYNKEVRAIDAVVDENTTDHRYNWRDTVIATYGDNSGSHTWDNLNASSALVDWTDIDSAEQVFNGLLDPNTGTPIMIEPVHIVAVKALERTASRILSATEIRVSTPGYATTGNPTQTNVANPYLNKYTFVSSRLLASRLATDTDWFVGDITKLARYMENWAINTKEAPSNSHDEFHRDIVQQFRADERGAYVVIEPRAMVKSTA